MDKTLEKFTWTISSFSELCYCSLLSEDFILAGYSWRIGIDVYDEHLSIHLNALASGGENQSRLAKFKFSLVNQVDSELTITDEAEYLFNKNWSETGFEEFITSNELWDSSSGFFLNDTCIIEVEISVSHPEDEKQIDQAQVRDNHPEGPEHTNSSYDELVDFRDLGKIEKAFVPFLEEVCTWYPSLVECQQKRSCRFKEWAFTALGEVLHFLKTKKVKDMNDDACDHLQTLWEELETFRFDLSWLEPHVQHALDMKSYIKRGEQVKKMKENVADLEMKLVAARRDLARVEDGFEDMHLDAKLGYGGR